MLSFSKCMMYVCVCVLFIYTISISIICVSQEEPSLIASNQKIYDLQVNNFWKEKALRKLFFWQQWITHLIIYYLIIYIYECVSLLAPECAMYVCVFVYVIKNEWVPVKTHITCQNSVNLTLCCIKHTNTHQDPSGTKAQYM